MSLKNDAFPSSAAFDAIAQALTSDAARKDAIKTGGAIFSFNLKNKAGQTEQWYLDLKETGTVGKGEAPEGKKADVTLTLPDEDFGKLVVGKANAQRMFMGGKLKVKGNVMKATKLEAVLKKANVGEAKAKLIASPPIIRIIALRLTPVSSVFLMKNDLHKTFGEIFHDDLDAFRNQLLQIQQYQDDRKESEEWVANLRFLDISKVPDLQDEILRQGRRFGAQQSIDSSHQRIAPIRQIPITKCEEDDGDDYIAVSWKWPQTRPISDAGSTEPPIFRYYIKRPDKKSHKSGFPDHYMDRVVRYAQSVGITRLWVDIECIYQRKEDEETSPRDKELGVQIMDVVYGDSARSVGLLTVEIQDQREIDMLSDLLSRSLFVDPKDEDFPELQPGVDIAAVQMLILHILSDSRWSRGWIFQEDHLASQKMVLLIPHSAELQKSGRYNFKKLPGELVIQLMDFRQTVTMFCLAWAKGKMRWPCTEILAKVKQYNICNKIIKTKPSTSQHQHQWNFGSSNSSFDSAVAELNSQPSSSKDYSYPTTTVGVLEDIASRSLENESDRIAIVSNALKCKKRLNTRDGSPLLKPDTYSLSAALLTVILLNGEILKDKHLPPFHRILPSEASIMNHTLQSYLNTTQSIFTAPGCLRRQSFIDCCRFISPTIIPRGIETRGFLFNVVSKEQLVKEGFQSGLLRLSGADREAISSTAPKRRPWKRKLDSHACQVLGILIDKLETKWPNSKLTSHMRKHILLDESPPSSKKALPSTPYVLDNMHALYRALMDGHELYIARLASAHQNTEPVALFIESEPDVWTAHCERNDFLDTTGSIKIFASWDKGRNIYYDKERLVSLQVKIFNEAGNTKEWDPQTGFMSHVGWVNGVWVADGEKMNTYVFALPGITQIEPKNNGRKKRKWSGDE
ncbi:hypothetical protein yc1106_06369 [Curvularia clavata]|uniref:Heterokaryon incompatibility domain-containing protein n=1 Tax=Curvularia clavata TaxID=95742 RepID=A0A9Q8ZBD4_CURCL|nr:hypothetical protein yc1106_06369 [Curvularia clavata]